MNTGHQRQRNASRKTERTGSAAAATVLMCALFFGLTACEQPQKMKTVDDALLPDAPAGYMAVVRQARIDRDTAKDNHAKAKRDIEVCNDRLNLAQSEVNVASTQLADAKLTADLARKNGTVNEVDIAESQYDSAKNRLTATRMMIRVRELEIQRAQLAETLAAQKVQLAMAEVELAKAKAAKASRRSEAKKIVVEDYQKQVDAHQHAVAAAQVKVNDAAKKIELAKKQYEDYRAKNR